MREEEEALKWRPEGEIPNSSCIGGQTKGLLRSQEKTPVLSSPISF